MFVLKLRMRDNTEKGSQGAALKGASACLGSPSVALEPRCRSAMLSWTVNDYLCSLEVGIEGTGIVRGNSTTAPKSTTSISYSEIPFTALRLAPQEEIKPMKKIKRGE